MPLLKAGMMSGSRKVGDDKVYLFDTLNNRGFSGGPIIRGEPESPSVIAVVCGYEFDAPLKIEQKNPCGTFEEVSDYRVRPNSGFMMGTPIRHAVNAAKRLL